MTSANSNRWKASSELVNLCSPLPARHPRLREPVQNLPSSLYSATPVDARGRRKRIRQYCNCILRSPPKAYLTGNYLHGTNEWISKQRARQLCSRSSRLSALQLYVSGCPTCLDVAYCSQQRHMPRNGNSQRPAPLASPALSPKFSLGRPIGPETATTDCAVSSNLLSTSAVRSDVPGVCSLAPNVRRATHIRRICSRNAGLRFPPTQVISMPSSACDRAAAP